MTPLLFLTEPQIRKIADAIRATFGSEFSPESHLCLAAARSGRLYRVHGHMLGGLRIGDSGQDVLRDAFLELLLDYGYTDLVLPGVLQDWLIRTMGWVAEQIIPLCTEVGAFGFSTYSPIWDVPQTTPCPTHTLTCLLN